MSEIAGSYTYPQYTNKGLDEGVFDQLMLAVKAHLQDEYDQQRIKASDFSKVFLGALEAVLGNSTQYLLGTLFLDQREQELINKNLLLEIEKDKAQYELDTLLPAQLAQIEAETGKTQQETINLSKQGELLDKQIEKLTAEISYLAEQEIHMTKQNEKIDKEIEFLTAKIASEVANVDGSGVVTNSLIGKQIELLNAQRLGFAGKIETDVSKMHADFAGLSESVNETGAAVLNEDTFKSLLRALEISETIASDVTLPDPPLERNPDNPDP